MADIPAPLTYATIVGRFISILADSSDVGNAPDIVNLSGSVTITPTVRRIHINSTPPMSAIAQTIVAQVVNGELLGPDGSNPLRILATDSPGINPSAFQYTASFALEGVAAQPLTVTFNAPGGTEVDLTTVIGVDPSPAIQYVTTEEDVNTVVGLSEALRVFAIEDTDPQPAVDGFYIVFKLIPSTGIVELWAEDGA